MTAINVLHEKQYNKESEIYKVIENYYFTMDLNEYVIRYMSHEVENSLKNEDRYTALLEENLVFPRLSNAVFLMLYADFEYFLMSLCKSYKKTLNLRLKVSDLKGDGVIGAINYLDRVVNIEKAKNNEYYENLSHWNVIRNYLIHNSTIINEKCKKSVQKLEIKTAESFDEEIIVMNINNCKQFVNLTESIQKYLIK